LLKHIAINSQKAGFFKDFAFLIYISKVGIEFYVINLDDRIDRRDQFFAQTKKFGLDVTRIKAVSKHDIATSSFTSPTVSACWSSHQVAAAKLLKSKSSHAVVFEDDAIISKSVSQFILNLNSAKLKGIDVLQIGYLTHSLRLDFPEFDLGLRNILDLRNYVGESVSRIDFVFRNWIIFTRFIIRSTFGILGKSISILPTPIREFHLYLLRERALRTHLGSRHALIYHSFEPGTHCYVMSKEFARVVTSINKPTYLGADLMFMAVAKSRNFNVMRIIKSQVGQSNSPSSINASRVIK
jgi:GR25 family glycosyltransferase involved in LPS biosynthesis